MREDLITSAVSFLNDPQVANAPLAKRIEFLESKELTSEEIEEALKRAKENPSAGTSSSSSSSSTAVRSVPPVSSVAGYSQYAEPPPVPPRNWKDYFIMATVTAGIGYGIYEVARRYVMPLVMPPTPPALEADKEALEAEFSRVQTLLDQMQADTHELAESEKQRQERFDKLVNEVEDTVSKLKSSARQRDSDMALVKSQVDNIRESLPKSLENHRSQQDRALQDLQDELKSLKQLLNNRIRSGGQGPPSAASVPSTVPGLTRSVSGSPSPAPPTTASTASTGPTVPATGSSSGPAASSATNGINSSGPSGPSGPSGSSGSSGSDFVPNPAQSVTSDQTSSSAPKSGIPAWQLAASKSEETA